MILLPGTRNILPTKYKAVTNAARANGLPLYLIIDEYDNFTNSLIRSAGKRILSLLVFILTPAC